MADNTGSVSVTAAVERAIAEWEAGDALAPQTTLRSAETVRRFGRRLSATGVERVDQILPAHCLGFIDAVTRHGREPDLATRHSRRTALRLLFRTLRDLGLAHGDPTLDLALPPRTSRSARPLTDSEIDLCRVATRLGRAGSGSLQRAVAWALAEATAVTSEISAVRILDLDSVDRPRTVALPGTRRHDARTADLTGWGALIVARHAQMLLRSGHEPSTLLTYRGQGVPGQHTAQAAVCNSISATLKASGLAYDPAVRPASVRNWAGRTLLDDGATLPEVARRMGFRTLDACVEDLGLEWR